MMVTADMPLFLFTFFLTNILFSLAIGSILMSFNRGKFCSNRELLLYSLGTGPVVTTLLLYYLFLFIPHRSGHFYFTLICVIYGLLALFGRQGIVQLCAEVKDLVSCRIKVFRESSMWRRTMTTAVVAGALIFLAVVFGLLFKMVSRVQLDGHDTLEYGVMGKILFADKSLAPILVRDFAESGFMYEVKHAPSFPLLLTWEKIVDSVFHADSDMFFKSISGYYTLLILGLLYFWLAKRSRILALLSVAACLGGLAFFLCLMNYHLDSYRIFFLLVSWIMLAHAVRTSDLSPMGASLGQAGAGGDAIVILFGMFSGFAAFVHALGMLIAVINLAVLFVFLKRALPDRLMKTAIAGVVILLCGGIHYVLEMFLGRGWLWGG